MGSQFPLEVKIIKVRDQIIKIFNMISDSLDDKGKGKIEASAFSLKSNTKKILSIIDKANAQQNITRYAVLHANDPIRAQEYVQKCEAILQTPAEYIMNISTIVGISAGIGSVAVAYMIEGENRDEYR